MAGSGKMRDEFATRGKVTAAQGEMVATQGKVVAVRENAGKRELGDPFLDAPESKKKLSLFGIFIAMTGAVSVLSVISTLLPVAALEIGGADIYAFTSTLNAVGSAVFMPLWGYIASRKPGRKAALFSISMLVGIICFIVFASSQSMFLVIATGPFYGILSAGVFVLSYAMVRDMYEPKRAGLYLGVCGAIMAVGAIIGPVVVGVVIQLAGWRAACLVFLPLMLIGAAMVMSGVRVTDAQAQHLATKGGKFDPVSTVFLVIALGSFVTMLSLGVSYIPFGSTLSIVLVVVAIVFGALTVWAVIRRGDDAIIPVSAVKDRDTLCFMFANLFTNFSNLAPYFFLPTYALYVLGASAAQAALTVSAFTLLSVFLSPWFGKMIGASGSARGVLVIGTVARIAVTVALLAAVIVHASLPVVYVVCLFGGLASASYGAGLSAGPQIQLKPELRVQGNSVIQMGQAFGNSIGLAIYTTIMALFGVTVGMSYALIVSACAAGLALVFVFTMGKPAAT